MSGSLGSLAVDASIPLKAGAGQANPLQSLGSILDVAGKSNQLKLFPGQQQLQQQNIQANQLALAQKLKQTAYQHLAAGVADGSISSPQQVTDALASLEHNYGIATGGVVNDIANLGGSGPDYVSRLKGLVTANTQSPEHAVRALAPMPGSLDVGGVIQPTLTPAPGMPGQGVPVPSTAGFEKGFTPGERLGTITRPATQADVDASGGTVTLGQPLMVPATTVPASAGFSPGPGGARVPAGALGPGGYRAPDLTRLGPAYAPPGAAGPAAPGAAPGSRVMTGPDGRQWTVPAAKVAEFLRNGYH